MTATGELGAVKARLAELIARDLRLPTERIQAICDSLVVTPGGECLWEAIGIGYSIDLQSRSAEEVDSEISSVAGLLADAYRGERVERPTFQGVDPEKTWMQYVEEAREST